MEVVDTGRRRRWSDVEKLRIVEESYRNRPLKAALRNRPLKAALPAR
jgi:transposase-like protein